MMVGGQFYSGKPNEVDNIVIRLTRSIRHLELANYETPILESILKKMETIEYELDDPENELLKKILDRKLRMHSIASDRFQSEFDSIIIQISDLSVSDLSKMSNALTLININDTNIKDQVDNLIKKINRLIDQK